MISVIAGPLHFELQDTQETRRIEAAGGTVQTVRRGNFTTYRVNGDLGKSMEKMGKHGKIYGKILGQ